MRLARDAGLTRTACVVLFVFALSLRLGYLLAVPDTSGFYAPDSQLYESLAEDLIDSGGFNRRAAVGFVAETERVPFYIGYLALFRLVFGSEPIWPLLGQCLIDAATCVAIALLAGQLWREVGVIAGLLGACNLNLIVHSAMILPESLFLLCFTTHLLFMIRFMRQPGLINGALAAGFFALALLTRTITMYFLPLLLITVLLVPILQGLRWPRVAQILLACLIPLALLVGPLLARNTAAYGHAALTSQGGTHSLYWVVPLAREFARGIPFEQSQEELRTRVQRRLEQQSRVELPENPFERSGVLMDVARGALLEMSLGELVHAWGAGVVINLFAPSWSAVPYVSNLERPRFYETAGNTPFEKVWNFLGDEKSHDYLLWVAPAILLTVILRALCFWGIISAITRRLVNRKALLYLAAVCIYLLAITGPVVGVKYRLPLEPVLTIFTAVGLVCLFPALTWYVDQSVCFVTRILSSAGKTRRAGDGI